VFSSYNTIFEVGDGSKIILASLVLWDQALKEGFWDLYGVQSDLELSSGSHQWHIYFISSTHG
jgi:hypothetical protein